MCDNIDSCPFTKASPPSGYYDRDHCNVYYVHRHGLVYCHPNAPFRDSAAEKSSRNVGSDVATSFCGNDRLTLMHFPSIPETDKEVENDPIKSPSTKDEANSEFLEDVLPNDMPAFFQEKLKNICEYCRCKQDILWNNFRRDDQYFDVSFRYVNKEEMTHRRCYLNLYALRIPSISNPDLTVSFSLVHHIRAEGDDFISASGDEMKADNNQEHIFGFIYGMDGTQMKTLLTGLRPRWQDVVSDHANTSTSITPRLFVAALISQYGVIVSGRIQNVSKNLWICDRDLQAARCNLENEEKPEFSSHQTKKLRKFNQGLLGMNIELCGTKSMIHYLTEISDAMVKYITPFEKYVEARLKEWHLTSERTRWKRDVTNLEEPDLDLKKKKAATFNNKLLGALMELDSSSEQIRDHDKLVMLRINLSQYEIDIQSQEHHIKINQSMVSSVFAARDRATQQSIMENTVRDGAEMKFMAILTAFFLPGTFMAVFLTTPMFNFLDDAQPLLTKKGIPLGIYWIVTSLGFVLLLIVLVRMHNSKKRRLELTAEADFKDGMEDILAIRKKKTVDKSKVKPGEQRTADGRNVRSTGTDGSLTERNNSSSAWLRNIRVAPRADEHV